MLSKILDEDEDLNPMLSVINLIDVLLVLVAALLIIIIQNPLNPFSQDEVTVIKNPGQANMEMVIKKGEEIEHYKASDAIGQGEGIKAGVAYQMKDGSFIYVPEK